MLNRIRVDFYFKDHFYSHNFTNVTDNRCLCGRPETTKHFMLSCRRHDRNRNEMMAALEDRSLLPDRRLNMNELVSYLICQNDLNIITQNDLLQIVVNFVKSCYTHPTQH